MAERLGAVGLHSDVQHGGVPAGDADAVVLLGLAEHPQQLVGDDPVQHRNDHHGHHEGQEGVHLFRETERCLDSTTGTLMKASYTLSKKFYFFYLLKGYTRRKWVTQ